MWSKKKYKKEKETHKLKGKKKQNTEKFLIEKTDTN